MADDRIHIPGQSELSMKELLDMTPLKFENNTYEDRAMTAATSHFKTLLRGQGSVREIFFSDYASQGNVISRGLLDSNKFACAYVCQEIRRSSVSIYRSAIDVDDVNRYMNSVYDGSVWPQIGYELYSLNFPKVVVGSGYNWFQAYLNNNPKEWGKKLSQTITSDPWMNDHIQQMLNGQWPMHILELNVLIHKVDQLDNSLTDYTQSRLMEAFPELKDNDFRDKRMLKLDPADINGEVTSQTDTTEVKYIPPFPPYVPRWKITTYGKNAKPFMDHDVREYGFLDRLIFNNTTKSYG